MSKLLSAALVILALSPSAWARTNPKQRTEELIAAFQAVKSPPEKGGTLSAADRKANVATFAKLDRFFDFDTLTGAPIAKQKSKFTRAQMKTFRDTFKQLIRLVSYPSSGRFLRKSQNKVGRAKVTGRVAVVPMHVNVPAQDLQMDIAFKWGLEHGEWRLIDVSFDGGSLVKDYENQFARIINKDGVDGLLKKLIERRDKELKTAAIPT